jgi:hypothetical protein
MILSPDYAGQLIDSVQKKSFEVYGEQPPSAIPQIFEVRQLSEMAHGIYEREAIELGDTEAVERTPGAQVTPGGLAEGPYVIHKRRFFERSFDVPEEIARLVLMPGGASSDGKTALMNWAVRQAKPFAEGRYAAEQKHAAAIFNQGGKTAGHAVFNNSIPGVVADPGGDLLWTGKPLFALSGNGHPTRAGRTLHNAVALSLTATNLETLHVLVADTNAYSESDFRLDNIPDTLVCGASVGPTAERVLKSDKLAGTANNDINPFRGYTLVQWGFITDTDAWAIGRRGRGLVWWQGDAPDIKIYELPDNRSLRMSMQVEFGAQVLDYRAWGGSNWATS